MDGPIQSQMTPPPVALQFVVTLFVPLHSGYMVDPEYYRGVLRDAVDGACGYMGTAHDVAFLPAPTHEGSQDG